MLNPYTQETLEASIRLNSGLLQYIDGNTEEAKAQIEESLVILRKWRKKKGRVHHALPSEPFTGTKKANFCAGTRPKRVFQRIPSGSSYNSCMVFW